MRVKLIPLLYMPSALRNGYGRALIKAKQNKTTTKLPKNENHPPTSPPHKKPNTSPTYIKIYFV